MPIPVRARAVAASALLLVVLVAGCGDGDGTNTASKGNGDRPVPVTVDTVRLREWSDTLQALGTVKARESVTVTAKVSETVQQVHFDSGDRVEAGAPLVTLSGQAQQASLKEAQAAATEAERQFRRQSELAGQQLVARAQLDTARAALDAARARVALIRAQLADRVIRAPFAGVLGLRQVSPGSLVTPGTPIATLDDLARVFVDFPVPEASLALVAPGQRLSGTATAYPGRRFEGQVATVDARVNEATRAVTVRGDFPNPDGLLRPGMLVHVTLSRPEREALLIPEIAVVQAGTESFVYRLGPENTVERVDVRIGTRREGVAEVVHGLRAGDRIVVDGTGKLRPGLKVTPAEDASRPAPAPAPAPAADEDRPAAPAIQPRG